MRQRHHLEGKKDDFSVLTPADAMELRREALDLVQTLGAITSVISFAVGAMGILSIMVLMCRPAAWRSASAGPWAAAGARSSGSFCWRRA
jgi:putative ABC transport system permease protein